MNLDIRANDRVHIFGRTGQGKTQAGMKIFDGMHARRKIILDSKPDKDLLKRWPKWVSRIEGPVPDGVTHVARFLSGDAKIHGWDDVIGRWVEGNIVFYFDELPNHATATKYSDHLQKICQTGRTFGDGAVFCSQRPVHVPNFTISEADHVIVYYTQLKSDRDKLEGATGVDWSFLSRLPPHHAGYYSQRLNLGRAVVLGPESLR